MVAAISVIGSAPSDFTTLQAWWDQLLADLPVAGELDKPYAAELKGELFQSSADNFSIGGVDLKGFIVTIRPVSGADLADVITLGVDPLYYQDVGDPSPDGRVMIDVTSRFTIFCGQFATIADTVGGGELVFEGIQVSTSYANANAFNDRAAIRARTPLARIRRCILHRVSGGRPLVSDSAGCDVANAIISAGDADTSPLVDFQDIANSTHQAVNCSLWNEGASTGVSGFAFNPQSGAVASSYTVKGNAIFGVERAWNESTASPDAAEYDWDYNATSDAAAGQLAGTGNIWSSLAADQYASVAAPFDLTAQDDAQSDLKAAAIQFAETGDLDILKQARSTVAPWIGAYEVPAGGGLDLLRLVAESVPTAEGSAAGLSLARSGTESVRIAGAVSQVLGRIQALGETIQVAESLLNTLGKVQGILETLQAEEARAVSLALARLIASPVEAPEAAVGARRVARSVAEAVDALEALSRARSLARSLLEAEAIGEAALPSLVAIDPGTSITLAGTLIGRIELTGAPPRRVDLSGRLSKIWRLEGKKP